MQMWSWSVLGSQREEFSWNKFENVKCYICQHISTCGKALWSDDSRKHLPSNWIVWTEATLENCVSCIWLNIQKWFKSEMKMSCHVESEKQMNYRSRWPCTGSKQRCWNSYMTSLSARQMCWAGSSVPHLLPHVEGNVFQDTAEACRWPEEEWVLLSGKAQVALSTWEQIGRGLITCWGSVWACVHNL